MARGKAKILGQNTNPYFAYEHTIADVAAVQAVSIGKATPAQQIRAFKWILEKGCMTYNETFDPQSERASNFQQGRRFVGLKLALFANVDMAKLKRREDPTAPLHENAGE